jgi:hypothetical protein
MMTFGSCRRKNHISLMEAEDATDATPGSERMSRSLRRRVEGCSTTVRLARCVSPTGSDLPEIGDAGQNDPASGRFGPWFETLRSLSHTAYRGADIGEVLLTAQQITPGDYDSWHDGWFGLGQRLQAEAEQSESLRVKASPSS